MRLDTFPLVRSERVFKRSRKRRLYFAYGSNLLPDRLYYRVGRVLTIGTYRLYGYKLSFNCGIETAFANVVKAGPKDFVEGVLYDIGYTGEHILDHYEGFYTKKTIKGRSRDEEIFFYEGSEKFLIPKGRRIMPDRYYVNIILDGCVIHGLKDTYNKVLDYKIKELGIKNSRHKKI